MSRHALKPLGGGEKTLCLDRFYGLDDGGRVAGQLVDADNVCIRTGGALCPIPSAAPLPLSDSVLHSGVYTLCSEYDTDYETPVTPAWVYAHIAPRAVLDYSSILESSARLLVADVGMGGRVNGRYRNALGAFSEDGCTYVLYEAVYNLIDQRRVQDYERLDGGTVSQFSALNADKGYYTAVGTLTQLWLDRIEGLSVESRLVDAVFTERERLSATYAYATLVCVDGGASHYVSADFLPQLGAAYTGRPDKVYTDVYPKLSGYAAASALATGTRRAVSCYNRVAGEGDFGAVGAHRLLVPDMRLVTEDGLSAPVDMPRMTAAVQHLDRLFGISGSRLYASAAGNCADFTEAVDDLPPTAAWQTVTPDGGGFTAILSFDGRVVAFTEHSMLTVRGNALPFTLSYEGAWGCPRAEAAVTLGDWLYFVSGEDVLRYNGSRVESIGQGLLRGLDLAHACLGTHGGLVQLGAYGFDGTLLFDPQSGCWTARRTAVPDVFLGEGVFLADGRLWRTEESVGDFSCAITLGVGTRRRITAITLTAHFDRASRLAIRSDAGTLLWQHESDGGGVQTVTFPVSLLCESEPLRLEGHGDVTVYAPAVRYTPLRYYK